MEPKPDLEEQFQGVIEEWKRHHGLRDDDPVLLCVELFRLHQDQWDALRRRDLPSFQQFREDIKNLTQAGAGFRQDAISLAELLKTHRGSVASAISPALAIFCVTLALLAGMILGGALL